MEPNLIDLPAVQQLAPPALSVALVALVKQYAALTPRGGLIVAAICSLAVEAAFAAARHHLDLAGLPLSWMVTWLTAMGMWSGGKAGAGR